MADPESNKPEAVMDPLWTEEECAAFLRVEPSTVRTWIKQGKIPYRKAGSLNRFHPAEIEEWTRGGRQPSEPAERIA